MREPIPRLRCRACEARLVLNRSRAHWSETLVRSLFRRRKRRIERAEAMGNVDDSVERLERFKSTVVEANKRRLWREGRHAQRSLP
jgi:hypothetical protein